jgi:GMP synthase PP-ATPase subunit
MFFQTQHRNTVKITSKIKITMIILSASSVLLIAGCGGGDSRDSAAIDAQLIQPGSLETKYSVDPAVIKADEDAWIAKAASDSSDPMHKFALAAVDAGGLQALNQLMAAEDKTELRKVFGGRGIEIVDQRAEWAGLSCKYCSTEP